MEVLHFVLVGPFNPIQDGFFRGCSPIGGGGGQKRQNLSRDSNYIVDVIM